MVDDTTDKIEQSAPISMSQHRMSYSIYVDASPPNTYFDIHNYSSSIGKIKQRSRLLWVDDSNITNCYNCATPFNFYTRSHHCRKCGNVFCGNCCDNWSIIPSTLKLPIPPSRKQSSAPHSKKQRLCNECDNDIQHIKQISYLISVFDLLPLDINDLYIMRLVNRKWNYLANYYLSQFRELQYKLPCTQFSKIELHLLRQNYKYFGNHSLYKLASIAGGVADTNIPHSTISCQKLMCSRLCSPEISSMNLVGLLDSRVSDQYLETLYNNLSDSQINSILPHLCHYSQTMRPFLGEKLIEIANKNTLKGLEIFWWLDSKISGDGTPDSCIFEKFMKGISQRTKTAINDCIKFKKLFNLLTDKKIDQIRDILSIFNIDGLILPIDPSLICKSIILDLVQIKTSKSRPIFIPVRVCDIATNADAGIRYILVKFDDIRQDYIIMKTICVMKSSLAGSNDADLSGSNIITYGILPMGNQIGIIEIIPDSRTVFDIQKNFTLLNYIMEHNPNESVESVKNKFMISCAIYCVITYLLGVGDRHLENILITSKGDLFHIDYEYIFGFDPKPMNTPIMRITSGMIDVIGGTDSVYYGRFIEIIKKCHFHLHQHFAIFLTQLKLLVDTNPPINNIDYNTMMIELIKRFKYSENYELMDLQMDVNIIHSRNSYNTTFYDFLHYYNKESSTILGNVLGSWWT